MSIKGEKNVEYAIVSGGVQQYATTDDSGIGSYTFQENPSFMSSDLTISVFKPKKENGEYPSCKAENGATSIGITYQKEERPQQPQPGTGDNNPGSGISGVVGYEIIADKGDIDQPTTKEAREYICGTVYSRCLDVVTENTKTVHIIFHNLEKGKEYRICLSFACLNEDILRMIKFTPDKLKDKKNVDDDGNLTLDLCADGKEELKLANGPDCGEEDYFWGRHAYVVTLFDPKLDPPDGGIAFPDETVAFYVSNYYPDVFLEPVLSPQFKPYEPIKIRIQGNRRPFGENYKQERNNYAVEIAKTSTPGKIYVQECVTIPENGYEEVVFDGKPEGDYVIKINEITKDSRKRLGQEKECEAEFTYYWVKIRVRSAAFWEKNDKDNREKGTKKLDSLIEIIPDPNGTDVPGEKLGKNVPPPPCADDNFKKDGGNCSKVMTGLGMIIYTKPGEFVGSIFSLVLGLAGGIAVVLIIFSGYRMIVSQGNPEKLEEARQQLVSAVVGLLFLILALVLIQVIGFDILRIPGFE